MGDTGMARISIGSANFFSKEAYQQYLEGRKTVENERYRRPDETIFDALLSEKEAIRAIAESLLF